jgi:hypothetical protein
MEEIEMLETIKLNSCPNPSCQRKFENLIVVKDNSKSPAELFYACPYCLTKLDPTATQVLQKPEISFGEQTRVTKPNSPQIEPPPTNNETPTDCPYYFGYLSLHYKDSIIPQQCLTCKKMLDCTLKVSEEKTN